MLDWFRALMPKEEKFFTLYTRHAAIVVQAAAELEGMFVEGANIPACWQRITDLEHAADDVAREVMLAVRKSFITPFDRSDITDLIQSMDDAVDKMRRVVKTAQLYEQTLFEPGMGAMASIALKASRIMAEAIELLPRISANSTQIAALAEAIVKLEGEADDLHDDGLRALYKQYGSSDPMRFIIGRALYVDLEGVVDSIDDVAGEITNIMIENI
jgi:predicted phosphate transport protein (TIGR00153 family)